MRLMTLVLAVALISCASSKMMVGEEKQVSGGNAPSWTWEPADEDTRDARAFCGVSQNLASEGEARKDALTNARSQIVDAIGSYGSNVVEQLVRTSGLSSEIINPDIIAENALTIVSEGKVQTRASQFHVEKWMRKGERGIEYWYKAYVLVLWNNEDATEAIEEVLTQAVGEANSEGDNARIKSAREMLESMKANEW